ncbi:MAG: hypothetical protein RLY87_947 [Chloroflexota bacterium]|jgi:hypothetical protein
MAMLIRDIRYPSRRSVRSDTTAMFITTPPRTTPHFYLTGILAIVALYVAVTSLFQWGSVQLAEVAYGATRTFHTDAFVGINDHVDQPSHFVAMNVNRQIVIMQIPAGDTTQTRVINGPALTGHNAASTPVLLTFRDTNNDTRPDMIVTAGSQSYVYLNRVNQFVLMPIEERATLYKP